MSAIPAYYIDPSSQFEDYNANVDIFPPGDVTDLLFSATGAETFHRWTELENTLFSYKKYTDDWDYEGAEAPRSEVVDSAIDFLRSIRFRGAAVPVPAKVTLSPHGSVIFIWRNGRWYADAEINEPRIVEWMIVNGDQKPEHRKAAI